MSESNETGDNSARVIYRPKNCGDQSFSAYNVATWGKLVGENVRHGKYGIGEVTRSNDMSREAWVRFDCHLHIVKLSDLEVLAEDGGVRERQAGGAEWMDTIDKSDTHGKETVPNVEHAKENLSGAIRMLNRGATANAEARIAQAYTALGGDLEELYD